MQKESIDLMNVEYEDVLHLYRGWRKSESALKDKNKELLVLRTQITKLQESHVKFRNQIQSLDSVKDLTVALQNQLTIMQQENKQLTAENKELAQLNLRADDLLKEKENEEECQTQMLRGVQLDFATMKGRYEETTKAHRELEQLASNEQALRLAAESRLKASEETTLAIRDENRGLRQQLDTAAIRLNQCDQELLHASEQLSDLNREVAAVQTSNYDLTAKEAEVGLARGDIARLLRLLEHSPATKAFVAHWQDSGGMDFVGIDREFSGVSRVSASHHVMEDTDMGRNVTADDSRNISRGNQSYSNITSESTMMNTFDLSPAEFAHLKRVHGGDPFPMTDNLADEAEYWVPSEAAKLGLQFLSAKIPHASPKVIMDFLRSMNKIWLRRERRKLKRVKQVMSLQIDDLRRQLAQSKPYKGVIAERQIRRLRSQVNGERTKHLSGKARSSLDMGRRMGSFEHEDQEEMQSLGGERRLCKVASRAKRSATATVELVSTEKLLEASLHSLESMGRQMNVASVNSTNMGMGYGDETLDASMQSPGRTHMSMSGSSAPQSYPNDSYLRGAMWLGRNLTIVSEELAEEMDIFRSKFMAEVANASQDADSRRSAHRLTLLANSGITQAHSNCNKARMKTREILQGASALRAGDAKAFKALLRTLPIESALTASVEGTPGSKHHNVSWASPRGTM